MQKGSKPRVLSGQECQNLLSCAEKNPRWRRELLAAVTAALRVGLTSHELRGLRLGDIFLGAGQRPHLAIRRGSTRNAGGARVVILSDESAVAAVRTLVKFCRARGAKRRGHFVFPCTIAHGATLFGKGWDLCRGRPSWGSAWPSLCRAAGLPGLRFDDLAHTYLAAAIDGAVDAIEKQFARG